MSVCHWCCHPFESDPIHYPYARDKKGRFKFAPSPYCSIDCCRAAVTRQRGTPELSLLRCLWRELDAESCHASKLIPTAPPFEALKLFGGHMTIDEFRKDSVAFPNPQVARGTITRLLLPNETLQVNCTATTYNITRPQNRSMGAWLSS